ncbi:hypothetical protein A2917_00475 [Candidatus Nomurabacteria bacterium RIFCSPLOWO2_01_FULL_42_17]|uniref:Uncharacterized protein n=1 Tax=Candidatus Nomurabacteria bacterium RIFCSPLOWO2_01_FULL_42_17 TaxID=1801780 RepID=A0A1F6XNT1_9BACT|nr:MAG: hypothetical protein A2917_00475 [Candidatus Nomurabacteria bacterium RIFCSPLOWO2_01_FULL_42_17]
MKEIEPTEDVRVKEVIIPEKGNVQEFEKFDKTLFEVKIELLTVADAARALPPEKLNTCVPRTSESHSVLLNGLTGFEVESNLCHRLIEAYRAGNIEALGEIPDHMSKTAEEKKIEIQKLIDAGVYPKEFNVEETVTTFNYTRKFINTITGNSLTNTQVPFGNDTTGDSVKYLEIESGRVMYLLHDLGRTDLESKWNSLLDFIVLRTDEVKKLIISSAEYQQVMSQDDFHGDKNKKRQALRKTYLEMEIKYKDKVIPIAERLGNLNRLVHSFVLKISEGNK